MDYDCDIFPMMHVDVMSGACIIPPPAASSTTGPDLQAADREPSRHSGQSPATWSIEEVIQFVREADPLTLGPHAELFRKHVSA